MKKQYIVPLVELTDTMTVSMMALSLQDTPADNSGILSPEETDWDIWSEDIK